MLKRECKECWYFDNTKVLKYKCNTSPKCPGFNPVSLLTKRPVVKIDKNYKWLDKKDWDAEKGRGSDHDIEKTQDNLSLSIVTAHRYDTLDEAIDKLDSNDDCVIGECADCLTSWVAFTKLWGETDEECGCSEDMKKYYNSSD